MVSYNSYNVRVFRITTTAYLDFLGLDSTNTNNTSGKAICYPDPTIIYQSNMKYYPTGIWDPVHGVYVNYYPTANYCNGIVVGKSKQTNYGYWNIVSSNMSYTRFMTGLGQTMNLDINPIVYS